MSILSELLNRIFARHIAEQVRNATKLADDKYWTPATSATLSYATTWYNHRAMIERLHNLAKTNPHAQRIVQLTTDFVIGEGITLKGPPWAHDFWDHPQNDMDYRSYQWCDELTSSGELFIVLSRNPGDRMSYVRAVPAVQIDQIETDPNDMEREIRYHQLTTDPDGRWWAARDSDADQIMLHYTINQQVGDTRGLSDLAPLAPWLERYELWLEDRVRINRYKGAYLWQVRIENPPSGTIEAKRLQYSRAPASGSIIVTDATERWEAIQPKIGADDVEPDGRALRLMIAAGAGIPLHFLAEGESATRATAKEMGTPTYRHFAHRQFIFEHMLRDIITIAAQRAGQPAPELDIVFDSVLALYPDIAQENAATPATTPDPVGGKPTPAEPEELAENPIAQAYKAWQTQNDSEVCPICKANAAQGWIHHYEPFQSGHMNAPAHDHCRCNTNRRIIPKGETP